MRALYIDKDFTQSYIEDLDRFLSKLLQCSTTQILSYENSFIASISNLKTHTKTLSTKLKSSGTSHIDYTLSIKPNFAIEYVNPLLNNKSACKFYMCVGGMIEIRKSLLVSQSISLSILYKSESDLEKKTADIWCCPMFGTKYQVIRKFHFDFDGQLDCGQWPISHLQYGGKDLRDYMPFNNSNINYELFSVLDTPRLPTPPYSLVLCFDMFLRSLETAASDLTKEKFWRESVVQAEKQWMVPFYKNALNFLEQRTDTNETLYDYFSMRSK